MRVDWGNVMMVLLFATMVAAFCAVIVMAAYDIDADGRCKKLGYDSGSATSLANTKEITCVRETRIVIPLEEEVEQQD